MMTGYLCLRNRIAVAVLTLLSMCAVPVGAGVCGAGAPPDAEEVPAVPNTPVGKQLKWVLKCINEKSVPDAEGRFTPRFMEQFTIKQVEELLGRMRDRSFKGEEVSLVRHEAEARADAISCLVGNEDSERYLSLTLTVNEETGKIAGMIFATASGSGGSNDSGWNDLDGDLGRMQNGVWFGAYQVVVTDPGTKEADVRIKDVYEFGNTRRLNITTVSRVYLLGAAGSLVLEGKAKLGDAVKLSEGAAGTNASMGEVFAKVAKGEDAAADALWKFIGRGGVEDFVTSMQDQPQLSFPYLSFAERALLRSPNNKSILDAYNEDEGEQRRDIVSEKGDIGRLIAAKAMPKPWKQSADLQKVGWFANNKETAYAFAKLRVLELMPGLEDAGKAWRQPQAVPVAVPVPEAEVKAGHVKPAKMGLDIDQKVWPDHVCLVGSEPGVMSLGYLFKRDDGKWYTMVMAWNNIDEALDEPRMYEMAQKGLDILARDEREGEGEGEANSK